MKTIPVIYTAPGCGPCVATKRWMQSNNIIYTELGPEDAIKAGYKSVPVIEYRGNVIQGFDIKKLKEVFPE